MKITYIAYAVGKDGSLSLHKHPVFTGDCAYDLGGEQQVQECAALKVREFTGEGEAIAAITDYARQHPSEDVVNPESFVLLKRFSGLPDKVTAPRAKAKRNPAEPAKK